MKFLRAPRAFFVAVMTAILMVMEASLQTNLHKQPKKVQHRGLAHELKFFVDVR